MVRASFFGDGPRVPMIAVSPYTKAGGVSHVYDDHTSIVRFIERNWRLPVLSARSWDNLPDPRPSAGNAYVPVDAPAVGDLLDLFDFNHPRAATSLVPGGTRSASRSSTGRHVH